MSAKRQPSSLLRRLDSLGREGDLFSSLVDDLFHFHGFSPLAGIANPNFSPAIDFVDKEYKYAITVEVPGVEKDGIQIEVDDGVLIIKGEKKTEKVEDRDERYVCERCFGAFRREIRLPQDSNKNAIEAGYKDGILTLDIPKVKTPEKETKKVAIKEL